MSYSTFMFLVRIFLKFIKGYQKKGFKNTAFLKQFNDDYIIFSFCFKFSSVCSQISLLFMLHLIIIHCVFMLIFQEGLYAIIWFTLLASLRRIFMLFLSHSSSVLCWLLLSFEVVHCLFNNP